MSHKLDFAVSCYLALLAFESGSYVLIKFKALQLGFLSVPFTFQNESILNKSINEQLGS